MKIILSFLLLFVGQYAIAKKDTLSYSYNFETKVINGLGDTLLNPWVGGLNQPQFCMTDLNGDGYADGTDYPILFNNSDNFIESYYPY